MMQMVEACLGLFQKFLELLLWSKAKIQLDILNKYNSKKLRSSLQLFDKSSWQLAMCPEKDFSRLQNKASF